MWFRGKQHGLGIYIVPNQEPKCGLWEDGKRIEWFDQDTAQAILAGQLDFTQYFTKVESRNCVDNYAEGGPADLGLGFTRPHGFEEALVDVKSKFEIL